MIRTTRILGPTEKDRYRLLGYALDVLIRGGELREAILADRVALTIRSISAAALGQLGRSDEARAALDKAITTAPNVFRLFVEQRVPFMGQAVYHHTMEGLRKAGWRG
jgi:hypothetical protein